MGERLRRFHVGNDVLFQEKYDAPARKLQPCYYFCGEMSHLFDLAAIFKQPGLFRVGFDCPL